jgi:aspartyl-tRNA(Asn)/glutamyl-tRNA(Gln) amidotransferase subunit A
MMNLGQVKRRILMGTYALSAGYYDAFYKRSQQVRTLIQRDFKAALQDVDVLLSPVAPSAAYKIGPLHSTRLGSKNYPLCCKF